MSIRQLITKLRAANIDDPLNLQSELARIDNVATAESSDTRALVSTLCELIYLRHQGHPLQDKYSGLCERLLRQSEAESDAPAREIAVLGAELLCGKSESVLTSSQTQVYREGIPAACVDILNGGWTAGVERVDDVVQWLDVAGDDAVVVMHVVRVLKWLRVEGKWDRKLLLSEWEGRYASGDVLAVAVVCELVEEVEEAVEMVQLCVQRNDGTGRRWFLKKVAECSSNAGGIAAGLVVRRIDWRYLIKAGDVDLVFSVLREVVEWEHDEGVELVRVLLHCATLSGKRRHVWDVILRVLESGVPEDVLCKTLVVFARTGGDVGIARVERLAGVVGKNGKGDICRVLEQLVEKGSCEAFVQVYVLVNREWGSREYTAAVKRYPGCTAGTKMLMIEWFNDGGFELEEEVGVLRERVREATVKRHKVLQLPPAAEYVRMLKFDVGMIEIGGVKVKFKVRREGVKCELDLRWSEDGLSASVRSYGDSYNIEETRTSTSLTIAFTIRKLYPEWEEPVFILNEEERRLPLGLKSMRAQGMPLDVFEKRWSVLPRAVEIDIDGLSERTIERMGAAIIGGNWCSLVYTESGVVGVLGRKGVIKCTQDEEFIVSRLHRVAM